MAICTRTATSCTKSPCPGRWNKQEAQLRERGYRVALIPEEAETLGEIQKGKALNFVTLGPRRILMVDGNPVSRAFFVNQGIECLCVPANELAKAAGAIGCLTGVLWRESVGRTAS